MNFWAYIRVELLERFPEQIELLGQMGLKACFFGLESLYDPAARAIGKGMGTEKVLATLEQSKKAWGELSSLHGSFIIGLPHETQRTADEWTEFVINGETALDTISCNALHMVPDSVVKQKIHLESTTAILSWIRLHMDTLKPQLVGKMKIGTMSRHKYMHRM